MIRLISILERRSRWLLVSGVFSGLIAGLSYAGLVGIINQGVLDTASRASLGLELITVCAVHIAMRQASTWIMLELSQSLLCQLRIDLCRRILASSQEKLRTLGKHRLLPILTHDVDTLSDGYEALVGVFRNAVVIMACLCYLGWQYWPLLLIFSVILSFGMAIVHGLRRTPIRDFANVRSDLDELYRYIRNLIDGSKELQLNSKRGRGYIDQIITAQAKDIRRSWARAMIRFSVVMATGEIIYFLAIGVLLIVIPQLVSLPTGVLASSAITLLFMGTPINDALMALPSVGRATVALNRIDQLEHSLPASKPSAGGFLSSRGNLRLELSAIRHRYAGDEDRQFTLGPLDLSIRSGEILFIVGGNGSGKSTLGMLILGLYRAEGGEIRLNGDLLTDHIRDEYRQQFAAVLSEFHLFETVSLEENKHLEARAKGYLKMLGMDEKVKIESGKFSTLELSTGQRKRLALVSAYIEDRPIYFFDEWAADQDPEFKRLFYRKVLPELKALGKAVIVITHDDAYFDCADRLVKLEEGKCTQWVGPSMVN
jgi:putative pyoverdin transport system ATP-binding/permease protein